MLDSSAAISGHGHERTSQFAEEAENSQYRFAHTAREIAASEIAASGRQDGAEDLRRGSRSIFDAQVWMGHSPWQPAAGWSVVAALLTLVPLTQWFGAGSAVDWRLTALLLLLVDPLWGSIWHFSSGRTAVLPLQPNTLRREFWLPYLRSNSPAMRLMGRSDGRRDDAGDIYPLLLRVAIPSALLALAVAAVLGVIAIGLTCLVILLTVLAWTSRVALRERMSSQVVADGSVRSQYGYGTHLLQALVTVALPWGLAVLLMRSAQGAETAALADRVSFSAILLLLWTLHSWGESRCLQQITDRIGIGLLAVSNVGIALLLIVLGVPLGLGILGVIWFATWYSIYSRASLSSIQGWWLLAMLVSATSIGFSVQL